MSYRDDLDAALARNEALERKVRELEARLAPVPPERVALTRPADGGDDEIARLVSEREAAARVEQAKQLSAEQRAAERAKRRLARRPIRVSAKREDSYTRITLARRSIRDGLKDQLFWGIFFMALNPGIFIVGGLYFYFTSVAGLDYAGTLAVATWLAVLLALNVVYARLTNRTHYLDLAASGHYAIHTGNARRAKQLGRTAELRVRLPTPDPTRLHRVSLGDLALEDFTDRDVAMLYRWLRDVAAVD
jgi:hypothetical protein